MDVRRVAHGREFRDALVERRDEAIMGDELRREIEKLDHVSGFCIFSERPRAEAIDLIRDRIAQR